MRLHTAVRMAKDFDWPKQIKEWCGELKEHTHGKGRYYSAKLDIPAGVDIEIKT